MDVIVGIDGTGPENNDVYLAEFKTSHVRMLCKNWHSPAKFYRRGPTALGFETRTIMTEAFEWIKERWFYAERMTGKTPEVRVFLTGYSRGGAAVIELAHKLKSVNIPVHAMLLFDAVDRSGLTNTDTIPSNVSMAFHALRDDDAGSRESFGHCGRKSAASVAYTEKEFFCTHGGVGGTPWKENGASGCIEEIPMGGKITAVALSPNAKPIIDQHDFTNVDKDQDKDGSDASWDWMAKNLAKARASGEYDGIEKFATFGKVYRA